MGPGLVVQRGRGWGVVRMVEGLEEQTAADSHSPRMVDSNFGRLVGPAGRSRRVREPAAEALGPAEEGGLKLASNGELVEDSLNSPRLAGRGAENVNFGEAVRVTVGWVAVVNTAAAGEGCQQR